MFAPGHVCPCSVSLPSACWVSGNVLDTWATSVVRLVGTLPRVSSGPCGRRRQEEKPLQSAGSPGQGGTGEEQGREGGSLLPAREVGRSGDAAVGAMVRGLLAQAPKASKDPEA